jgi:hypothetical protein
MKKQTEINFSKISKEQTNDLTAVVNETIAMDFIPVKSFTIVDLWNIQQRSKTIRDSRKLVHFIE